MTTTEPLTEREQQSARAAQEPVGPWSRARSPLSAGSAGHEPISGLRQSGPLQHLIEPSLQFLRGR